jgi:hypothetical protein
MTQDKASSNGYPPPQLSTGVLGSASKSPLAPNAVRFQDSLPVDDGLMGTASGDVGSDLPLAWVLSQPDLPALVQVMPTPQLFRLLGGGGDLEALHDGMEIVAWVRGRALVRLFDHELWREPAPSATDSDAMGKPAVLDPARFLEWVSVWSEIDPVFAGQRFLELDEEVMVLMCRALFEVVPLGLEGDRTGSDDWFVSPDGRFHLRFRSDSPADQDRSAMFLKSLFGARMDLAGRVLAYSAMLVEAEAEEEAHRWRMARMADDGFVSRDEALRLLRAYPISRWTDAFLATCQSSESLVVEGLESDVAGAVDDDVVQAVEALLASIEDKSDEGHEGAKDLAPEGAEELVRRGSVKLAGVTRQRQPLLLAPSPHDDSSGAAMLLDAVLRRLQDDPSRCGRGPRFLDQWMSRWVRLANVVASVLREPASDRAQTRAVRVVRSYANLGLEWLVANRVDPALWSPTPSAPSDADVEASVTLVLALGPEALFRAGCDLLGALAAGAACALGRWEAVPGSDAGADGTGQAQQRLGLDKLLERGHYAAIADRLTQLEPVLEPHVGLLARCLLRRVPVAPRALLVFDASKDPSHRLDQSPRLITTGRDYQKCWSAVSSWSLNWEMSGAHEETTIH